MLIESRIKEVYYYNTKPIYFVKMRWQWFQNGTDWNLNCVGLAYTENLVKIKPMYIYIFIAGFGGGAIRGLVGFIKHQFSYKNVSFKWGYFLGMTFVSGMIGLVCSIAMKELGLTLFDKFTPALAFVIGYAGGDFLENIYKIIIKKSNLYEE